MKKLFILFLLISLILNYFLYDYYMEKFCKINSYISPSNIYSLKVYETPLFWTNICPPGDGSSSPCIVVLSNNITGKIIKKMKLEMKCYIDYVVWNEDCVLFKNNYDKNHGILFNGVYFELSD